MSPSAASFDPLTSNHNAEPVARLGPHPIPRVRPSTDRSPSPDATRLSLRFADRPCTEVPEIEIPEGQLTLVEGTHGTEAARHRLTLDAARLGNVTVNVVGTERLDTTGLARRAQAHGLDPGYVLRSSIVARAFTAYQLSVLLEEQLPRMLDAENAAAGLVLDPLRLYTDEDVGPSEARRLTEQAIERLSDIAAGSQLPLVVVQPPRGRRRELTRMLREAANTHVLVGARSGTERARSGQEQPAYTVHMPEKDRTYRVHEPRPEQARLDQFHDATAPSPGDARGGPRGGFGG